MESLSINESKIQNTQNTQNETTNFEKVNDFHKAFGLSSHTEPQLEIFKDTKTVDLRLNLIAEEFKELQDAVKEKDFVEVIDALSDILYVVYGTGVSFGIDLDKSFDLVHNSNMTKLCISEEEAEKTVTWYKDRYTEGKSPYDTPCYRKAGDNIHWVVYNKSSGKILKSINYKPVSFESMLNNK